MADSGRGGGAEPSSRVVEAAVHWFVLLSSGEATAADREAHARWLEQARAHRLAWTRLEGIGQRMRGEAGPVDPGLVREALAAAPASPARRRAAKALLGLLAVGGGAWFLAEQRVTQAYLADHRTGVGERAVRRLGDGTRLTLNTDTALDVHESDAQLRLHRGEILVETAPGRPGAGWQVMTPDGTAAPVGTRFTVRRLAAEGYTRVAVAEGAVRLIPRDDPSGGVRLDAGREAVLRTGGLEQTGSLRVTTTAWLDALLIADRTRLEDFLRELDRYRSGWLSCSGAVAALRLSGAFPLDDTDRVLAMLQQTLPVRLSYRTPYWVRVEAG